jgi:MoxR-like ATPase
MIQDRWGGEAKRPPLDERRWFEPLVGAPAVEAELQKLLDESGRQHKEIIGAIFRRAVTLHRRAGTDGFLGAQPRNRRRISLMVGNLYACAVGHDTLFVLVDDDPTLRRTYDVGEANSTRNRLMWVRESPDADGLSSVLRDENVWKAYERMLADVTSFPVARRNHNKRGKLNVLSGKRLDEGRSLADLAEELLVDEAFLENALALLRDKGQVIFYGPPGTGKTFVARKLMEYLAPDEGRREIVQFHPSYSYEDFVHGYRPVTRADGALAYELKPGPLMRLARQAGEVPGEHVLLVDEINRGNLPKILGELLYLLEYREDKVVLMYGEGEARFSLPEDLLIVGTMNTADRSIALIDAAMRRRFHFVPFFPNEWPLEGLLRRWLQRHRPGMTEVAEVVDRLNAELRERFGPHLQVGPSHFMKKALDEAVLQRVWDYDVMPFLEDQLFGQEEELEGFKLERLRGSEDADHYAAGTPAESGAPVEGRGGAAPNGQEDR